MTTADVSPAELGWTPFFQSQLSLEELETTTPCRITAIHRGHIEALSIDGPLNLPPFASDDDETGATVGDWVLVDDNRICRVLDRKSLFKRRAAGTASRVQLIAANVDTVFIVSSCNQDFNIARIERYLSLAHEAEVTPVIVLTKADLASAPQDFANQASKAVPGILVEAVNGLDPQDVARLSPWCGRGQTVAFLGSSGVGKSTLVNTLTGTLDQETSGIREDDAKGRHTTTGRSLLRLSDGGWLMDTPGMREIQLTDVAEGIEAVFEDVVALANNCRFSDCTHTTEPGCAVRAAINSGALAPERLERFQKLQREDARNSETTAERRQRMKGFGKMIKEVVKETKRRKGR